MANDPSYRHRRERIALTAEERRDPGHLARELEQAQNALASQDQKLHRLRRDLASARHAYVDLYETTPVAFVSLDANSLIQRANAAARRLLGEPEVPPIGQAFSPFVEKKDQGRFFRAMRRVAATGQAHSFELALRGRSDRSIQTHIQVAPRFDAEGQFRYWHLAFFDISPLRRREAELKHVHSQLQMAARAAKLGTWIYDLDNRTTKWDAGLYRLLRLKPRAGPENEDYFFEFIHPEDRTGLLESIRTYLTRDGDDVRDEFRVVRADGETRWLAARGLIFRDAEGRPRHIAGINFDITHRKQSEERVHLAHLQMARQLSETERINEELSQYAYAVSHDLKDPLRAIRNYADFLYEDLADSLSGIQKKYLEGMQKAVLQGEQLIGDLLDLSRIGALVLEHETADVPGLVDEIQALLGAPPDVDFAVDPEWPSFHADRTLLKQILQNLISNAIKFNRRTPKQIAIGWQPAPEDCIELFVRDNGIGIAPQYREQIFRIFQRLHTQREYEGTGIGLAIVRKAAYRLGGSVRLESDPETGTTFFVMLPREIGRP
jgi:PAS domain S-box-containing protein